MIEIDGSKGEGGGQIIRTSLSLSALTQKPFKIINIRKGRPNPGLQPQHLTSVKAVKEICNASVEGLHLGSSEIIFYPRKISGGSYSFNIETAGSVILVAQTLIPAAIYSKEKFFFSIKGGTDVPWSPTIGHFQHIFCYLIESMGANIDFLLKTHGFYPKGGGEIEISIKPSKMKSINLKERGEFKKLEVHSIASSDLIKSRVCERQLHGFIENINLKEIHSHSEYVPSNSTGSSIYAIAEFEKCRIGADIIGIKGKPAESIGKECANKILKEIDSGTSIDTHALDQMLIYLALYGGCIKFDEITSHAKTNIDIIEKFLPVKFLINEKKKIISI